jgi:N-acetylglucosamine-6-phosphate deacetylase
VIGSEFVIEHGSVLIEDGRIARLSDASQTIEADPNSTLNLTGSVLMPGLIDVHIHGAAGVDTMVGAPEDFLQLAAFLASKE